MGNPPFIGAKMMRMALGDGYVDAIQTAWPEVPQATDFVLRWWHQAADLVATNKAEAFGFITSNSISQTFNRRVIEPFLADEKYPLSLIFVIPDHPWVDSSDGAAVRIAITAARAGHHEATLLSVKREHEKGETPDDDLVEVFSVAAGRAHANLKVGANINKAVALQANRGLCAVGFKTIGAAFQVDQETASSLGLGTIEGGEKHIRPYLNGRDLAAERRGLYVIDFFGLSRETVQHEYPAAYQYLLNRAKPERDQNRNKIFRENWWIIGHPRPIFRQFTTGLACYLATIETAKHRFFTCLPSQDAPDSTLVTFGLSDALHLGLLSGRIHIIWALVAGGRLGVGNDPRYNKTRCFETFPFPDATPEQQAQIRDLAERLDAHRKRQQAQHPELTLTGMYNVLEKLRAGEPLTAKDKTIHEQGLVSLLRELHDELDKAVFAAYGWDDLAEQLVGKPGATTPLPDKPETQAEAEEELLCRLVALNSERAAEEARGHIRWLRPEYQNPSAAVAPEQSEAELDDTTDFESVPAAAAATGKLTWPKQMREQVAAVRYALSQSPLPADALAAQFKRSPKVAVQAVLDALEELGMVQQDAGQYRLAS